MEQFWVGPELGYAGLGGYRYSGKSGHSGRGC